MQQLFEFIAELIGAHRPDIAQPRPVMRQGRVGELFVERGIVDAVQLQRKEQQLGRDRVDALMRRLKELGDCRIGDITGAQELGIADDPADDFLQFLVFRDGGTEFGAG